MAELKITGLGTIKGENFTEVSIDKFLKTIEKGVMDYELSFDEGSNPLINYKVRIYKSNDDDYTLYYNYICDDDGKPVPYKFKCVNAPHLNSKLTKLSLITAKNDYEEACYNKIASGSKGNTKENAICMNYLKKMNKYCRAKAIIPLSTFVCSTSSLIFNFWLSISISNTSITGWTFAATIISLLTFGYSGGYIFVTDIIAHAFKARKIIKRNMRRLDNKLGNVDIKNIKYEEEKVEDNKKSNDDVYHDKMIDKMNDIYNVTNTLSDDDRKKVLYELRKMLIDYATEWQEISQSNKKQGLTLEDDKSKLIMNTISKMNDLEMTIFEMKKSSSSPERKTLLSDSGRLMEKIDKQLNEMNGMQVMMTSDGKMVNTSSPKRK